MNEEYFKHLREQFVSSPEEIKKKKSITSLIFSKCHSNTMDGLGMSTFSVNFLFRVNYSFNKSLEFCYNRSQMLMISKKYSVLVNLIYLHM